METALAKSQAKLNVLKEYERSEDGSSSYLSIKRSQSRGKEKVCMMLPQQVDVAVINAQVDNSQIPQPHQSVTNTGPSIQTNRTDDLLSVMQKQNAITELFVK